MSAGSRTYAAIYAVVARIPRGRVATYGQVARLAGMPGQARLVGYALNALPARSAVPWHRVINARGCISARTDGADHEMLQGLMLEREGVRLGARGAVSLAEFQWRPSGARAGHRARERRRPHRAARRHART